jgi:hypothetical protein
MHQSEIVLLLEEVDKIKSKLSSNNIIVYGLCYDFVIDGNRNWILWNETNKNENPIRFDTVKSTGFFELVSYTVDLKDQKITAELYFYEIFRSIPFISTYKIAKACRTADFISVQPLTLADVFGVNKATGWNYWKAVRVRFNATVPLPC